MSEATSTGDNDPTHLHDTGTLEDITNRLGRIGSDDFERLCYQLLPREFPEWGRMEPRFNAMGKSTAGTPDAHVRLEDGTYIAFQFTTLQESVADRMAVQRKVRQDIDKIKSPKCPIWDKTVKVVVCVNTDVGGDEELYHAGAAENGWSLDIFSVHRLATLMIKHPGLCNHFLKTRFTSNGLQGNEPASNVPSTPEFRFEAGPRILQIREDIGLNRGQFMQSVGMSSERTLRSMETGETDCPESLLERVASVSGASLGWLKSGAASSADGVSWWQHSDVNRRYPLYYLTLHSLKSDLEMLRDTRPDRLYLCVELRSYRVMILTQTGEHHWRVFDLNMALDFWNWADDFRYIGRFLKLLSAVFEAFPEACSRVVPIKEYKAVRAGRVHPRTAINAADAKGRSWAIDLDDINHERYTRAESEEENGAWFLRVQQAIKDYRKGRLPKQLRGLPSPLRFLSVEREEKFPTSINLLPYRSRGPSALLRKIQDGVSALRDNE